jgi:transcriptional regulator with AAA-type ATPase domain
MRRVRPPQGPAVLLSWASVNARAAPLLGALDAPSPLQGRISRVYLCWRDAAGAEDRLAVRETRSALHQALDPHTPEIVELPWKTEAQPTDHAAIRPFAEQALRRVRAENIGAHIYLHLSPGTPAMHAVWLVLGATGLIEGPLTMIQGIPEGKRAPGGSPIEAVPLEVDTWLRRFRTSRPASGGDDEEGGLWSPEALAPGGAMRAVLEQLQEWAPLRAPVLLWGERGTGKSTLANFLRAMGPFQRQARRGERSTPWPSVVCGQFRGEPQMARAELFGHRKGAFTGAEHDREGLLEQADGDCLFFDEVADLDRDTQRLLMAALEGRGFHRLGDSQRRQSTFRLICATNRPLAELAQEALDADFLDRIAVFTLRVPPLRECRPDLGVLWSAVLGRVVARSGVPVDAPEELSQEPQLLEALARHPLLGNLRDLQRVAWHLVARLHAGAERKQAVQHALGTLREDVSAATALPEVDALRARLPLQEPLPAHLEALRARWVQAALAEAAGNGAAAARMLGVPRETLKSWRSS